MTLAALLLVAACQQVDRDAQCIKCHEDQAADVKDTMHEKAGVGCVSCHGTDEIVNEKHRRTPAFRPAKLPQVAEVCGSCHKGVLEAFSPSPHFAAAAANDGDPKRRSSCSSCHDYHTTPPASGPVILNACLKCHGPASHEIKEGRTFFQRLEDHRRAVRDLAKAMNRLERAPGIRISDLAAGVEEGRAARRALAIAQHGLEWATLNAAAGASAGRATATYNTLVAREESFARRFLGLGFFLGLSGLSAVAVIRRARVLREDVRP